MLFIGEGKPVAWGILDIFGKKFVSLLFSDPPPPIQQFH